MKALQPPTCAELCPDHRAGDLVDSAREEPDAWVKHIVGRSIQLISCLQEFSEPSIDIEMHYESPRVGIWQIPNCFDHRIVPGHSGKIVLNHSQENTGACSCAQEPLSPPTEVLREYWPNVQGGTQEVYITRLERTQ